MNGREANTQRLPSLPARTMSSKEVILSILIPRYKRRTGDIEGDSDS